MAIVDDFKDIASRMKGELKPKAELPLFCLTCHDSGWLEVPFSPRPHAFVECGWCGNPNGRPSP